MSFPPVIMSSLLRIQRVIHQKFDAAILKNVHRDFFFLFSDTRANNQPQVWFRNMFSGSDIIIAS